MLLGALHPGLIGGGLLIAVGLLLIGKLVVDHWRTRLTVRRWNQRSATALRARIEQAEQALARRPPVLGWKGFRRFVVSQLVRETSDVVSIYLQAEDRRPICGYEPGQYVTVRAMIPGDGKATVRCYSLSDRPGTDQYRITVRATAGSQSQLGAPHGKMSTYLNRQLRVGDLLELQSPRGDFYLRPDNRPRVLIGAGIGITPVFAMALEILERDRDQPLVMFCGMRNSGEHPFKQALQQLAKSHPNFLYFPCYSRPLATDVAGKDYQFPSRIDVSIIQQIVPNPNFPFYVCGPNSFMGTLVADLMAWGVTEADLHFEAFGPSSVQAIAPPRAPSPEPSRPPMRVTFNQSQRTECWRNECSSLLELAELAGVSMPAGCRAGNCGMCVTTVLKGKVGYTKSPTAPISGTECLACVARPVDTDLVLEA